MSLSKVVKSKQCYLHPKTNTDNMHIHVCLNFIFKKEHTISSEIVHLLKVKLSLQNGQRWLLLLSWYSKFSGGGGRTPEPPFQISKYMIFQFNTTQHKPLVKNEVLTRE